MFHLLNGCCCMYMNLMCSLYAFWYVSIHMIWITKEKWSSVYTFLAPHYYRVVKSKICFCLSQICSKAVSTSSQLAVHMKTHTEDCSSKFFKCFLCDERFKGPAEVRKHVVVHAVNGKYTCPKVGWYIYCMFCCMPQPVKTGLYCKLVVCQTLE